MSTLLDIVTKNMQQQEAPAVTDETARARNLFAAKSGKAVGAPRMGQSNLAERAAVADTQAQLGQVQQEAATQVAGLRQAAAGQQQEFEAGVQNLDLTRQAQQQQGAIQRAGVLQQAAEGRQELGFDQRASRLEQQAFRLAQQDKQYVDTLRREGEVKRLNSSLAFKRELQNDIFGASVDLLKKDLEGRSILDADDRAFKRASHQMKLSDILAGLRQEARDARNAGTISGLTGLATSGIGAAATAYGNRTPQEPADMSAVDRQNANAGVTARKTGRDQLLA